MTLRKYLVGTHISSIYTNNLERIIFIEVEGYNKSKDISSKKLIVELMGRHSNIILVDSENVIIDALRHFSLNSGSYRNIFAGEKYVLPKADKLDFFDVNDAEEFYAIIQNNSIKLNSPSLVNIVSNTFTGISKASVKAIEAELHLSDDLNAENVASIFNYISRLVHNCSNNICKKFESKNDYFLVNSSEKADELQINWFLDDYYTSKEIDATFTKLIADKNLREFNPALGGGSLTELGSYPLLLITKLLGLRPLDIKYTIMLDKASKVDLFNKVSIIYENAVAAANVGLGVKKDGNCIISGTKGYIYVPAPWWKTEYFEVRFEDSSKTQKYFTKFDGDGLRYELADFLKSVNTKKKSYKMTDKETIFISGIIEDFLTRKENNGDNKIHVIK